MGHGDQSEDDRIPCLMVKSTPVTPLGDCELTPAILDLVSSINCGKMKCWTGEAFIWRLSRSKPLIKQVVSTRIYIIHQDTEWVVGLLTYTPVGAKFSKH